MRFILKPGGVLLILAVGALLLFAVIQTSRQTKQLVPPSTTPPTTPAPAPTPATPSTQGWPYTLETPTGTLQSSGFEKDYTAVRPYDRVGTVKGEIARHWYDDSSWAPVTLTYARSQTRPHSGSDCQEIRVGKNTADGAVQMVQPLQLIAGKKYTAGLWLRADRSTRVQLQLRQAGTPFTGYASTEAILSPQWQYVSASGVIGADTTVYFYLKVSGSDITVWADDATLEGPL